MEKLLESGKVIKKFSERRFKVVDPAVKKNLLLTSELDDPTYDAYEEDIGIVNILEYIMFNLIAFYTIF